MTWPFNPQARAGEALRAMAQKARSLGIRDGVAVVGIMEDDSDPILTWWQNNNATREKTEDKAGYNFLAIALVKVAMAALYQEDTGRKPEDMLLTGEVPWKGGIYRRTEVRSLLVSYSGGPPDIDLQIAQAGMEILLA